MDTSQDVEVVSAEERFGGEGGGPDWCVWRLAVRFHDGHTEVYPGLFGGDRILLGGAG